MRQYKVLEITSKVGTNRRKKLLIFEWNEHSGEAWDSNLDKEL